MVGPRLPNVACNFANLLHLLIGVRFRSHKWRAHGYALRLLLRAPTPVFLTQGQSFGGHCTLQRFGVDFADSYVALCSLGCVVACPFSGAWVTRAMRRGLGGDNGDGGKGGEQRVAEGGNKGEDTGGWQKGCLEQRCAPANPHHEGRVASMLRLAKGGQEALGLRGVMGLIGFTGQTHHKVTLCRFAK